MTNEKENQNVPSKAVFGAFEPNWDTYSIVSCAAKLEEIKLVESSYAIRPQVFEVVQDFESMDLRYSGACSEYSFDSENGVAFGHFVWTAEIKSGKKNCLKIKSDYLLVYTGLKDCDIDHIEFFFKKVGRFATYPYFRSHFSHHTTESRLMIPPLPTLRERVD